MPLFDDDLHGVWFERRVCLSLCTRPDRGTAGPSFSQLHVNMPAVSRAASRLPAVSWKKNRRDLTNGKYCMADKGCWYGWKERHRRRDVPAISMDKCACPKVLGAPIDWLFRPCLKPLENLLSYPELGPTGVSTRIRISRFPTQIYHQIIQK